MDSSGEGNGHRQALDLAAAGRPEEALASLQEYLLSHPQDGEALNDAGALLCRLGRHEEAARHLKLAAHHLKSGRGQALANLAEVYLACGRPVDVAGLFQDLAAAGVLGPDLLHRTIAALLEQRDFVVAVETVLAAGELTGQADGLAPTLAKVRGLRPHVGLIYRPSPASPMAALEPFLAARYPVRTFSGRTRTELNAFLESCEVAWLEGCTAEAIIAAALPRSCRLLLHVRPSEAYGPCLGQVNWDHVGLLTTSGTSPVREFLSRRLPELSRAGRIIHIPRGVDFSGLPVPPTDKPQTKHLACLNGLCLRGNPMLLLQALRRLLDADAAYCLHLAGHFRDDMLEAYVRQAVGDLGLAAAVRFDGWQEDLPGWLADKDCIVSAEVAESDNNAALTAMAMGLRPIIHASPGADELYGEENLFATSEDFCRLVLSGPGDAAMCRQFVQQRYPMAATAKAADEVLKSIERELALARSAAAGLTASPTTLGAYNPLSPKTAAAAKGAQP